MKQPLFRHEFAAMTTRCELQFHGVTPAQGREVAERIEARVAALVQRYNFHAADSWLNRAINGRRSDAVDLDAETASVLALVREHAERTHGVFDITVGTYAGQLARARTATDVAAVRKRLLAYVGLNRWSLEGRVLRFDNPYTRIDLGGVIKEHAVDVSARIAIDAGIGAGLVNYGGDLFAFGLKPGRQRFVASVPNPLAPQQMLFGLDLEDQALTTSAHYARQRVLKHSARQRVLKNSASAQSIVLSHVVGADVANARWLSASVVSRSALVSGIYSTALLIRDDLVLPDDVIAIVVDRNGQLHTLKNTPAPGAMPDVDSCIESTRTSLCA